jgi:hypothetical protein
MSHTNYYGRPWQRLRCRKCSDAESAAESAPLIHPDIAQHLETLALLSLPERADLDERVSNERQSQSADLSTLAEKQIFLPIAL